MIQDNSISTSALLIYHLYCTHAMCNKCSKVSYDINILTNISQIIQQKHRNYQLPNEGQKYQNLERKFYLSKLKHRLTH